MKTCIPVLRGTAALATTNLQITLPDSTYALRNGDLLKFAITNAIPAGVANTAPVVISVNGTTFALKDRLSNNIVASQLRSRWVYTMRLGAETPTFTLLTCVPDSGISYPTFEPPAA